MKRPSASVPRPSASVIEDNASVIGPSCIRRQLLLEDRMELEKHHNLSGRLQSYPIPKPSQAPPPAVEDNYSPTALEDDEEAASTAVADNYSPTATVLEDDEEDEQDDHDEEADYDHDEPSSSAGKRYRSRAPERATPADRQGKIKLMKQEPKYLPAPKHRNPAVAAVRHVEIEPGSLAREDQNLPCWVGQGNCLISTWILGKLSLIHI